MILRNLLRTLLLSITIIGFNFMSHASHVSGGNITYQCLGNGEYEITLTLYGDCESSLTPPQSADIVTNPAIDILSDCGFNQSLTLTSNGPPTEVSQLCASQLPNSTCNGGSLSGYVTQTYSATINLADCDCYTFSYELCCRNGAITNIDNPQSDDFYVESTMCSDTYSCNNSPVFTAQPVPYVCLNQTVNYDYGVVEQDGHTLEYTLVEALDGGGVPVTYSAGYNSNAPIVGINCDPNTGELVFTPTTTGVFVVVVEVTEYDSNGDVIGTYLQDIQFVVQNCSNTNPATDGNGMTNTSGNGYSTGPNSFELCEGQTFCFDYTFVDSDPGTILSLTSNVDQVLNGATFNVTGTNPAIATICWTAPGGSAGPHSFNILVEDDACPINGFTSQTFSVNVIGSTTAGPDQTICGTQGAQINAQGGTVFNWNVLSGDPINVGTNFSCNPCTDPIASPSVTTTYEVVSNLTGTCVNRDTITINVVPDFTYTLDYNNTSCLMQDIDIEITPNPAGNYTYNWTPGQYLSSTNVGNPTATFTSPGTYDYDVEITSPDGCLKTETVSIDVNTAIQPSVILDYYDTTVCLGTTLAGGPGGINARLDAQPPSSCGPSPTNTCSGPAQNTTIGNPTGQNTSTSYPAPYAHYWRNAKHQFLFTAAELQAMGMTAGKIFMIEWETTAQNGATTQFLDYTISMGCTSTTDLTDWETGLTQVFDPKTVNVTVGANMHIFDQAYEWDGVSNLVVEVCYNNLNAGTWTNNWSTPWTTTTFNSSIFYRSDSNPACPSTLQSFNSPSMNRPITKFYHCLVQPNPNNYDWEWTPTTGVTAPNTQNPDITPTSSTTYQVMVTDPNGGCKDSAELVVTVPELNVSIDTMVCPGQDVILEADNNGQVGTCPGANPTYYWYTNSGNDATIVNQNVANTTANPTVSDTYYVEYTDGCGCTLLDSVVVNTNGIIETFDTLSVCPGDQIMIHGNMESALGDYSETYSLGTGCDSVSNVHLEEYVPIQVVAPNDTTICAQQPVTLNGSGVQSYTWDNGAVDGGIVNPASTTTYTVTGTDINGCETTDQMTITTEPLDDASFTINQPVFCQSGADPIVTVTGEAGGVFSANPATLSLDPVTGSIDLDQSPLGTYDVTYTVDNFCENSSTVTVQIANTSPADFMYNNATYCANDADPSPVFDVNNDGNLDGTAGTFSSTNGLVLDANTGDIDLDQSTPGTYTVTNDVVIPGCAPETHTFDVTIYGLPDATIDGDSIKCQGDPLPSLLIQLTGSGPFTIDYDHDGNITTVNEPTNTHTILNAAAGNYTLVSVTDDNGCSGNVSGDASVTITPYPVIQSMPNVTGCMNEDVNVQDFVTNPSGATIDWTVTSDVGFGTSGSGNIGTFAPSATGLVTVTAQASLNGCVGPARSFDIEIFGLPNVSFTANKLDGCAPMAVAFNNTTQGANSVNCEWTFGNGVTQLGCQSISTTYLSDGCYDVTMEMTDANGCTSSTTYDDYICVYPNPSADFYYSPENPNVNEPHVEFINESERATIYTWNMGNYASSAEENPEITFPETPAEYPITLIAENEYGCTDTSTSVVVVDDVVLFFVPNSFTPDGDRYNEIFKPVMTSGFDPFNYNLKIFNRWGEIVFESNDANVGWDGTFQGKPAQDGSYVWVIEFKETMSDDKNTYKGHVNLLR